MATPLDFGLLQKFGVIWPFLFILVLIYAILSRIEAFKEKPWVVIMISAALAFMTMFSRVAVRTINMMAPWFVLVFIFFIFILIAYQAFGIKEQTILETITGKEHGKAFFNWVLALALIIGLGSLATVISEERGFLSLTQEEAMAAGEPVGMEASGFFSTITHPKVLGMAAVLLIAIFTVQRLAAKAE